MQTKTSHDKKILKILYKLQLTNLSELSFYTQQKKESVIEMCLLIYEEWSLYKHISDLLFKILSIILSFSQLATFKNIYQNLFTLTCIILKRLH